jgi:hypothetical protein
MEIGCGGGILLKTALELVRCGAAIDHSPDMAQLAEDNEAVELLRLQIRSVVC